MAHALMLVTFSVPPDVTPEFTRFYHHEFLPAIRQNSPEVVSIKRYEEFGVSGSLRWYNKMYLTFYELSDASVADAIFAKPAVEAQLKKFREWKETKLFNFDRRVFSLSWEHPRNQGTERLVGPFFLWQTEAKPDMDEEFVQWYEQQYLPLQVADIPTWSHVHRYVSEAGDTKRRLTIFECAHEPALLRSLEELRTPHRIQENYDWAKRVEATMTWQDATSFRPIYRAP